MGLGIRDWDWGLNKEEKEILNKLKTPIKQINELDNNKIIYQSGIPQKKKKAVHSSYNNIPHKNTISKTINKGTTNDLSNNSSKNKYEDIFLNSGKDN